MVGFIRTFGCNRHILPAERVFADKSAGRNWDKTCNGQRIGQFFQGILIIAVAIDDNRNDGSLMCTKRAKTFHSCFRHTSPIHRDSHNRQLVTGDLYRFFRQSVCNIGFQQDLSIQSFCDRISCFSRCMRRRKINYMHMTVFHIFYFKAVSIFFISSANSSSV